MPIFEVNSDEIQTSTNVSQQKHMYKLCLYLYFVCVYLQNLCPPTIYSENILQHLFQTRIKCLQIMISNQTFSISLSIAPSIDSKHKSFTELILIILNSYLFPIYIAKKILKQSYPKLIRHSILQPIFYHHTFYILRKSSFRPFAKIESNSIFL